MADLRSILQQAGFSGQSLNTAYAIAMAESGGNARAFNGNTSTGDQSYGLFQINMLGGMGPERRKQFGLSSNDDLYNALENARVAYKMSKGGTDWSPWSTYKRGDYKKYMGQSGAAVSGGAAPAPGQADKPAPGDILGTGNIGPGLASTEADPFAPDQAGDPFAAPKAQPTVPGQNPMGAQGAGSTSLRDKIIATAMQQLGTPYSWGGGGLGGASRGFAQGAGTVGFDCSSLLMYAFGKNNYSLPRVSYEQLKRGERTSVSSLRPGDLVGFRDGSHIALYIGGGKILEAPKTGETIRVRSLGSGSFDSSAFGVRLNLPGD
jgi:cell wall-associated NlpC family hydrolase